MRESKTNYQLGVLVRKLHPEIADRLLRDMNDRSERDLNKIYTFYSRFESWNPFETNKLTRRRIFITAMLMLYNPKWFQDKNFKTQKGFNKRICGCFACTKQVVFADMQLVRVSYNVYEEFRKQVDQVLAYLNES